MHSSTWKSLLLLGLAHLVPEVSARPSSCPPPVRPGKAIYTISNGQHNSVIALPIDSKGLLSKGTSTSTGGAGSSILVVNGNTKQPGGPDALVSQSALTVAGNVSQLRTGAKINCHYRQQISC
ncbi:hypothetical protein V8C42DRAFT_89535 [Trichoderma barbatum]